jgi:hypothetical protein
MLRGLTQLDDAITKAHGVLGIAESSGMEVSQARLDEDQSRDALTKARLTIHSLRKDLVDQDLQKGLTIAANNLHAGQIALVERDYRRKGLGVALVFIFITVLGLFLYIRQAPDGKGFSLTIRAYVPKDLVKRGEWFPPAIARLK